MAKIDKKFLAKLKGMLIKLENVRTVDGRDLMVDGDLEVGKDIMLADADGEFQPAPSGEYDLGERIVIVEAGRIVEIREPRPEEEEPAETEGEPESTTETAEEDVEEEAPAEAPTPEEAEEDEIKSLVEENDRLKAENAELRARIAELEESINSMAAVPPAEETKPTEDEKPLAAKLLQNAYKRQ